MPTSSPTPSGNSRTRPPGETSEARIAKALAHPLRARILQRLGERVASPGDLAVELGAPLGVVSYHVRMLRDYDCVELVRTEPRRGALQHFYRATARPNLDEDQWRTLPSGLRARADGRDDRRSSSTTSRRPPTPARSKIPRSCSPARRSSSTSVAGRSSTSCSRARSSRRSRSPRRAAAARETDAVFPTELADPALQARRPAN